MQRPGFSTSGESLEFCMFSKFLQFRLFLEIGIWLESTLKSCCNRCTKKQVQFCFFPSEFFILGYWKWLRLAKKKKKKKAWIPLSQKCWNYVTTSFIWNINLVFDKHSSYSTRSFLYASHMIKFMYQILESGLLNV